MNPKNRRRVRAPRTRDTALEASALEASAPQTREATRPDRKRPDQNSNAGLVKLALVPILAVLGLRALRMARRVEWRGKTALITGGSRGLGLEMARQLAREGANLVLVARSESDLDAARAELEALGGSTLTIALDITAQGAAEQAISRTLARFGSLDLLVNNAGQIQVGPLEHMSESDFENALAVHVRAPLRFMRAAVPYLRSSRGRIVNISSIGGLLATPHMAPYVTSKFGLTGLSDAMRHELAKDGIAVTTVCPGVMRSGSHVAATFKGQHAKEYRMFKLAIDLPGGGIEAPKAAARILDAAQHADPHLTFPLQMRVGAALYHLMPNAAGLLLAALARLMPAPTLDPVGDRLRSGAEIEAEIEVPLTKKADAAVEEFNQQDGDEFVLTPPAGAPPTSAPRD